MFTLCSRAIRNPLNQFKPIQHRPIRKQHFMVLSYYNSTFGYMRFTLKKHEMPQNHVNCHNNLPLSYPRVCSQPQSHAFNKQNVFNICSSQVQYVLITAQDIFMSCTWANACPAGVLGNQPMLWSQDLNIFQPSFN